MTRKIDPAQPTSASAVWLPYDSDLLASLIQVLSSWTAVSLHEELATRSGLKLDASSVSAIYALGRVGSMRPSELAAELRMTAPTASKMLTRLKDAGLIVRVADPKDGRASAVRLTVDGSTAAITLFAEGDSIMSTMLDGWSDEDRMGFARMIRRLAGTVSPR